MSDDEEIPELFEMLGMIEKMETEDNFNRELGLDDFDPSVIQLILTKQTVSRL